MKTVVLKCIEGRVSLGHPLMTIPGLSKSGQCITILVHNVPENITDISVLQKYESAIIIPQGVFEFNYTEIDVAPGSIVWLDESRRPHGILKNGIAKVQISWDNGDIVTHHLSGSITLAENMQSTIDLMHGEGKGLNLLDPYVLSWYKNRQYFTAQCGPETFRYDRNSNK